MATTKSPKKEMTFQEALQHLNIEDYGNRIFNSNSHGELFHLCDYIEMAQMGGDLSGFREWFESIVKFAKENWSRPQSIYQHILQISVNGTLI